MSKSEIKKVHNKWESVWERHRALDKGKFSLAKRLYSALFPLPFSTTSIINILHREIHAVFGSLENLNIVECGCGTVLISRQLAHRDAHLHLFDISSASLKLARYNFAQKKQGPRFTRLRSLKCLLRTNNFKLP